MKQRHLWLIGLMMLATLIVLLWGKQVVLTSPLPWAIAGV